MRRYGTAAWHWAVAAVIAVGVVAVYWVTLRGPFLFDDLPHILGNPGLAGDRVDIAALLRGGLQETRPLYLLSLAANYAVGGTGVVGYHAVNIALHIVCAMLVYALAIEIRSDLDSNGDRFRWLPEIAALVFAFHPLATESVGYVNSRSGVMATGLGLAGLLLYLRFDRRGRRAVYAAALVCTILAMAAKESAVSFPVLAVAYVALLRADRRPWRTRVPALAGLCGCALTIPLLYALGDNPHADAIGSQALPLWSHYLTQVRVIGYFVLLSLVPWRHNFDYDPAVSVAVDAPTAVSALFLVGVVVAAWLTRRREPVVSLGVVWFFVALGPTNPGVPFANFMAERYLYASLIGIGLVVAAGVCWLRANLVAPPWARGVGAGAVVALLALLTVLTAARNQILADPLALWAHTAAQSPNKARPHVNLGILLIEAGDLQGGYRHLSRAVEVAPTDPRANYNLGVLHQHAGRREAALASFERAVALGGSQRHRRACAQMANTLALERAAEGRLAEAEALFRRAIAVDDASPSFHFNLAVVLLKSGRTAEAKQALERALELDPTHKKARARLASLAASDQPGTVSPP